MSRTVQALSSSAAVGGTHSAKQPQVRSDAIGSWNATYAGARAGTNQDSNAERPAAPTGSIIAGRVDGTQARATSPQSHYGNGQPHPAIEAVMARQGTLPSKGNNRAAPDQSNGEPTAASLPQSANVGDDTGVDDPTTAGQTGRTDTQPQLAGRGSDGTRSDGTAQSAARQASQSPGAARDARTDTEDRADGPAQPDEEADHEPSSDHSTAAAASKSGDSTAAGPSQTSKTVLRGPQTKHANSDGATPTSSSGSGSPHIALPQAALAANALGGTDPAKKLDDRDSIALAASATSGAVAPSLPSSPAGHNVAGAPDPDPPTQELLQNTAVNLVTDGGGTARIILSPPTLGHVEVSVTMTTSGAAHISITAATADGYAALTASHADLLQHLAQSGVAVGSVQTQLQSDSGQNGASGSGPRQSQNRPAPAASWVKQGQDETVIAYA